MSLPVISVGSLCLSPILWHACCPSGIPVVGTPNLNDLDVDHGQASRTAKAQDFRFRKVRCFYQGRAAHRGTLKVSAHSYATPCGLGIQLHRGPFYLMARNQFLLLCNLCLSGTWRTVADFRGPVCPDGLRGPEKFTLSYMRPTDKWCAVYSGLTLEECLNVIREDPLFSPYYLSVLKNGDLWQPIFYAYGIGFFATRGRSVT